MGSLEIGKLKYIELRRNLITEGFKLPGYNRLESGSYTGFYGNAPNAPPLKFS